MAEEVKDTVQATDITPAVVQDTTTAIETTTQTDIEKLDAAIAKLEADGSETLADTVQVLKDKRDTLIAEAEAEAKKVETEVVTVEETFQQKYGNILVNGIEIVGIGAIIYRLFFF